MNGTPGRVTWRQAVPLKRAATVGWLAAPSLKTQTFEGLKTAAVTLTSPDREFRSTQDGSGRTVHVLPFHLADTGWLDLL